MGGCDAQAGDVSVSERAIMHAVALGEGGTVARDSRVQPNPAADEVLDGCSFA